MCPAYANSALSRLDAGLANCDGISMAPALYGDKRPVVAPPQQAGSGSQHRPGGVDAEQQRPSTAGSIDYVAAVVAIRTDEPAVSGLGLTCRTLWTDHCR
jgi:hypothetical protein